MTVFDRPFHIIRLGYLTRADGGTTLTVGDRIGGTKAGVRLTPAYDELLSSLDPMDSGREFSDEHLGLISWMVGQGFLAAVSFDADPSTIPIIPVPRRDLRIVESLDEGYLLAVADTEPVFVTELGARLGPLVDGRRTLGEIVSAVTAAILTDPAELVVAEQNVREQGCTLDSILLEETLAFVKSMLDSRAVSFEPGD